MSDRYDALRKAAQAQGLRQRPLPPHDPRAIVLYDCGPIAGAATIFANNEGRFIVFTPTHSAP